MILRQYWAIFRNFKEVFMKLYKFHEIVLLFLRIHQNSFNIGPNRPNYALNMGILGPKWANLAHFMLKFTNFRASQG